MKSPSPRTSARFLSLALGLLVSALLLPSLSRAQATTGFNQTAAGPWNYNDTTNWVGGTINGTWDASLVTTAAQTITFGANTTLGNGLLFTYTGSFNENLQSDGTGNYSITLDGDILVNTASANRTITIGSSTANQNLSLDLDGGIRTFDVRASGGANNQRSLTIVNNISNGGLILQGGGNINLSAGTATSTTTLTSLTLKNTNFSTNAFSDIAVSGALTIDGAGGLNAGGNYGGISILTLSAGSTRNHTVTADSLVRANAGVVLFRGTSLGAAAPGTNNTTNIIFTHAPTSQLVGGGGAAGTTTISILPWALGGSSTSTFDTFVTYDSTNGIRPLAASEFANSITDGAVSQNNVQLLAGSGTTTINSATTVNSLYLVGDNTTATVVAGMGTLTITSGAVFMTAANTQTTISANLNFGTAQGVIGYGTGKGTTFTSAVSGSGGLVLHQEQQYATLGSPGTGVSISGNAGSSTYTGDTYVLGAASIGTNGFLPNGSRTGDLYVEGILNFSGGYTINGLNGSGNVSKSTSGAVTFNLGDNNASGNFTGVFSDNGSTTISKIGTGTQTFGGANTYKGGTHITQGTLLITNTTGSGTGTGAVTISSGARFGGSGITTGTVTASAADSVLIAGGVNSLGTLNLAGGLTAASGATFNFNLNGTSTSSINFGAGTLTMGGTATFNFSNLGTVQTGTAYSIFTGSGNWSSVTSSFIFNGPAGYVLDTTYGGGTGYIFDSTNDLLTVQFSASAIPEPSTLALLAGSGVLLFTLGYRRKTRPARTT